MSSYPLRVRSGGVERLWRTRLRWRMRGAWLWPAFGVLTLVEAVLLARLPPYGRGPGGVIPGFLLAGFANLLCVAVLAPLAGRRLRRLRPDLPRAIAANYAGTALLCLGAAGLLVAGLAHRPEVRAEHAARAAQLVAVHDFVVAQAPRYRQGLALADTLLIEQDVYRTCVPGPDPKRPLCLFVRTGQDPVGVTVDRDRAPNDAYRRGGFR